MRVALLAGLGIGAVLFVGAFNIWAWEAEGSGGLTAGIALILSTAALAILLLAYASLHRDTDDSERRHEELLDALRQIERRL